MAETVRDPWLRDTGVYAIPADAPERFTVDWHGQAVEFRLVRHVDDRPAHYLCKCPKCSGAMYLRHRVFFGPRGATFSNPGGSRQSLECPHRCGWHVHVRDGRATDS